MVIGVKIYQKIAQIIHTMDNNKKHYTCLDPETPAYQEKWYNEIEQIENNFPSGGGLDGQRTINLGDSKPNKIKIEFDYHLMDDHGYYDGWLKLNLILKPDMYYGFGIKIQWYVNGNEQYKVRKYKPLLEDYLLDLWSEELEKEWQETF